MFQFDQLLNYSEFQNLYDQFKITRIVLKFSLITNPNSAAYTNTSAFVNTGGVTLTNWYPKMWFIRDYDGGTADTLASIKERQGVKCVTLQPNRTLSISLRPKIAIQTYRTSTTTGYGPKAMFLDFANGYDVPHYGLNTVIDTQGYDPSNDYPFKIRVERQFFFTCKDVR